MSRMDLTVNNDKVSVDVEDDELLVYVLREKVGVTGTNVGCLGGDCGACTVLVDGRSAKSCSVLARTAADADVTTIEGLATGEQLDPVQRAFIAEAGFQCGFCLPGMLLVTRELLDREPDPSDEEILRTIDGNLCRCTGYNTIVSSVKSAARMIREQQEAPDER